MGARARIVHFGGDREECLLLAVHDEGRRLQVRDQSGREREFVLNPATAAFVSADSRHGPRLELLE